jgi:hypothetical protein
MLGAATRVLRLSFSRPEVNEADDVPRLEFVAYAADRLLVGSIQLEADRLTDLLNACDELELVDITWLGLHGQIGETSSATITRSELLVVKAGLPRGNPARRHRTRQAPVVTAIGPYLVYGYLHSRPGSDPLVDLGRRAPMVPLTDASICYERNGKLHREDASTFIVNRDRADSIRRARESEFPGERPGLAS